MAREPWLWSVIAEHLRPPPKVSVETWCRRNLQLPAPQTSRPGPFSVSGCEYLVEPLNLWNDPTVTEVVLSFGSQAGKTTMLMAGVAWSLLNDPGTILWVMPNRELARDFAGSRWMPLLEATGPIAERLPRGKGRHDYGKGVQRIGQAVINFVGSNSPGQLSSRPVRRVVLDEVDKFPMECQGEGGAVDLACQRTKGQPMAQKWLTSTPTIAEGGIWQHYLQGDQRRYFVPCPHCQRHVVFGWSSAWTVMPELGCEAWVRWDKEAKGEDGQWDLERVLRSAHAVCPHCHGEIRDHHKTSMVRQGEWRPTRKGPQVPGVRSYHLPSLYANMPATGFGALAVSFLRAHGSTLGIQGWVNGNLSEPWEHQDTIGARTELVQAPESRVAPEGAVRLITFDYQFGSPHFWFVVREWDKAGNSIALDAGSLNAWSDVEAKIAEHKIPPICVGIDCGFNTQEVFEHCIHHSKVTVGIDHGRRLSTFVGWYPMRGEPGRGWKHSSGARLPWQIWMMEAGHGRADGKYRGVVLRVIEHAHNPLKDMLDLLRKQRLRWQWAVGKHVAVHEYWRHLDGERHSVVTHARTGKTTMEWVKRSRAWPNHLLDCEVMQLALAAFHRRLVFDTEAKEVPK